MNRPTYDTEDLWRKDRDHSIHPWTDFAEFKEKGSLVIAESSGSHVFDSDGNRYLDGIGGLWCVNIGYGNEEMVEAIADQARRMPYYSTFTHVTTPPAAELAAKLAELAPGSLNHVFYGASGSVANDSAGGNVRFLASSPEFSASVPPQARKPIAPTITDKRKLVLSII